MGATPERDRGAASDLLRRGYPHGRRFSSGLSNIPKLDEQGSAAQRRAMASGGHKKPGSKNTGGTASPTCMFHKTVFGGGVCHPCVVEGKEKKPSWWPKPIYS